MQDIDLTPSSFPEAEFISGTMVTLKCDEKNREEGRKKNQEVGNWNSQLENNI